LLLFRIARRTGNTNLVRMATETLDAMRAGGVFDHVGFGFHRYATDRQWLVPHFEKMLYDQAMLMLAYTEAWQITGADRYRRVCHELADYLRREMTSVDGAFFSAQDADSEGVEGKFYTWTLSELSELLAPSQIEILTSTFHVRAEGNAHDEATGSLTGANILHMKRQDVVADATPEAWADLRTTLLSVRGRRVPPITDDKILTDWNGLMIGALAHAGRAFQDGTLTSMAVNAYDAVQRLCGGTSWVHRYRDGHRHVAAMLDDHAAIGWAAAELYQTTAEQRFLDDARHHADTILATFLNEQGALCVTAVTTTDIPVRRSEAFDSAYPSGNSMAAWLFAELGAIADEQRYRDAARTAVTSYGRQLEKYGPGFCMLLSVWNTILHGSTEIVLCGTNDDPMLRESFSMLASSFLPSAVFIHDPQHAPFDAALRPSVMICSDYQCERPFTTIDEVRDWIMRGGSA
jgi:uncharacterized protein YyaL (SSP411 family)